MTSYFLSAPVEVLGEENIVTALVRKDMNTQRLYLHSVITKENLLNKALTGLNSDSAADVKTSEPRGKLYSGDVASILQNYLNYKPKNSTSGSLKTSVSQQSQQLDKKLMAEAANQFMQRVKAQQKNAIEKGEQVDYGHGDYDFRQINAAQINKLAGILSRLEKGNLLEQFQRHANAQVKSGQVFDERAFFKSQETEALLNAGLISEVASSTGRDYRLTQEGAALVKTMVKSREDGVLGSLKNDGVRYSRGSKGISFAEWAENNPIENFAEELESDSEAYVWAWVQADMAAMTEATKPDPVKEAAYREARQAGKTELTFEQWQQVRTPEFKAWFGDWENNPESASKVVNPKTGEPLVVYHGTPDEFHAFSQDGLNTGSAKAGAGFFFTPDLDVAKT